MATNTEPSKGPPAADDPHQGAVAALLLEARRHLWSGAIVRAQASLDAASAIQPDAPGLAGLREKAIIMPRLSAAHARKLGAPPNLARPSTYNERILHRIIHDRSPILKTLCDKIAVRDFIRERVGEAHNVPLIGVWSRAEDIDWATLPDSFVIKSSHASGQHRVVLDKAACDRDAILRQARGWLEIDFGQSVLEWGYVGLPRHILVEPILQPPEGEPLVEVHVHVFGGRVGLIRPWTGAKKTPERRGVWCTRELRPLMIETQDTRLDVLPIDRLTQDCLISVAEKVAAEVSHLRVDFYLTRRGLLIGELTPYAGAGRTLFLPRERDAQLGRLWDGDFELLDIPSAP
ncbi:hypothetical protein CSW58_00300 [Caulobacter sp. B11]|nr:hypothetical protein CSW58_00300 [Caulobacter sp. B11]